MPLQLHVHQIPPVSRPVFQPPFFEVVQAEPDPPRTKPAGALFGGALVEDDLRSGRLVRPLKESVPLEYAYYIVHAAARPQRPQGKAFKEWLLV